MKRIVSLLSQLVIILVGCNMHDGDSSSLANQLQPEKTDTLSIKAGVKVKPVSSKPHKNAITLKESFNEDDEIDNEYLSLKLKPIRENFKRINSIKNWALIKKKDLWESTEGGEVTYYYSKGILEKIITRHYGETFQQLSEYYLLNEQLSFVFEKSYNYNRPIYYDSILRKENNDTATFNFEESEVIADRAYFDKGKLIHSANSQDCGSPFSDDYLLEQEKQIKISFNNLIKLRAK